MPRLRFLPHSQQVLGDSPSRQLPRNHINCILTYNLEKCCMPTPTAVIMSGKSYHFAHAVHMQGSAQEHQALMLSESIPLGLRSSKSLKRLTMNLLATRDRTAPRASHQYPRGCLDTCTGCRFKWEPFKGMYEFHVGPSGHARRVASFSKHQGCHAKVHAHFKLLGTLM